MKEPEAMPLYSARTYESPDVSENKLSLALRITLQNPERDRVKMIDTVHAWYVIDPSSCTKNPERPSSA
jgi:hypothetical protein